MVHLKLASVDDFKSLCNLNVLDSQKKYMMTTNESVLLEMNEDIDNTTNYLPYSIYTDHEIIGFLMINRDVMDHEDFKNHNFYTKKCYFITHFMIDSNFQGNGFGKLALIDLENNLKDIADDEIEFVVLFHHEENQAALNMYESLGYAITGIQFDNSVMRIKRI